MVEQMLKVRSSMQRWQFPIHNVTLKNFVWYKYELDMYVYNLENW